MSDVHDDVHDDGQDDGHYDGQGGCRDGRDGGPDNHISVITHTDRPLLKVNYAARGLG